MIYINKKLRINRLDEHNLTIETSDTVKVKGSKTETYEAWHTKGYYPGLRQALLAVLNRKLCKAAGECSTIGELLNAIKSAEQEIVAAISSKENE